MKKIVVAVLVCLLLSGCLGKPGELDPAMELRTRLQQASQCSFTAQVTAQYGNEICKFTIDCTADRNNCLLFTVSEPSEISGITGRITGKTGELIFDDAALQFPLMADQKLSPISGPWVFLTALKSGYLTSACREEEGIRLSIDDSYEDDALRLDIWLDDANIPQQADILQNGTRILTLAVKDFEFL